MSIEIKMPALSPTMEEGTLAKWLVKEGDTVKSGDIMAEIETDKATMEFEAVDEGTIARILVAEGTDSVKVGAVIAILAEEGEDAASIEAPAKSDTPEPAAKESEAKPDADRSQQDRQRSGTRRAHRRRRPRITASPPPRPATPAPRNGSDGDRVKASPLARRIAADKGVDLAAVSGIGAERADREGRRRAARRPVPRPPRPMPPQAAAAPAAAHHCRAGQARGDPRHPARGDQAQQHPQDDRAPPDRVEADRCRTST